MEDHIRVLRMIAGLSQKQAALMAGVSERTWRRYENENDTPPAVVVRWLQYEAGMVPGWPAGWRVESEGVTIPGVGFITHGMIEGAGWAFGMLSRPERRDFVRRVDERERVPLESERPDKPASPTVTEPAEAEASCGSNVVPLFKNG